MLKARNVIQSLNFGRQTPISSINFNSFSSKLVKNANSNLSLVQIVQDWVKDHCKHHYMYSSNAVWCGCATGLFEINDNTVDIMYGELGEHRVTLQAADPKFFKNLEYYIKSTCEKNLL